MRSSILIIIVAAIFPINGFTQKISGKLLFDQSQTIGITMDVKSSFSQEAMGQAIDFTVNGTGYHSYRVTNATADNTTLHHEVKRISFNFDGGGQKRSFDSDNKKDMDSQFGPTAKEILGKTFDIIIDPSGKTLMAKPEKIELSKADERMVIVNTMLRDVTGIVYPPKKNESSFFMVLPDKEVGINDTWSESGEDASGKFNTTYTLSSITDSVINVDISGSSITKTKAEIMGTETYTTMNNSYTGKIILDKATGIIREKIITITSTGSTEMMNGTIPVTSKTIISIHVNPAERNVKSKM